MATQKYVGFLWKDGLYYNDTDLGSWGTDKEAHDKLNAKYGRTYKAVGVMFWDEATNLGWKNGMSRVAFTAWAEAHKHLFRIPGAQPADIMGDPAPITPGPRKPKPQVCPEVWFNKPEVDTTDYMAAVRAMCGDSK